VRWRTAGFALVATAAVCFSSAAQAWVRVGVGVGPGYWGGYGGYYAPYGYAPYGYAPPVVVPAAPVVVEPPQPDEYVERPQESAPPASNSSGTWWYCAESKTYYPYVKECPSGWQQVPAAPPSPNQ
jgi:hypothetical protein